MIRPIMLGIACSVLVICFKPEWKSWRIILAAVCIDIIAIIIMFGVPK